MKELLERIVQQLDRLDERQDRMDRTLIRQESSLDQHIRRTELAEEAIELLRQEIKPVKKSYDGFAFILKLLGTCTTVLGLYILIKKTFL
jgi:uncharacterized protein (UPF0335 family)